MRKTFVKIALVRKTSVRDGALREEDEQVADEETHEYKEGDPLHIWSRAASSADL